VFSKIFYFANIATEFFVTALFFHHC